MEIIEIWKSTKLLSLSQSNYLILLICSTAFNAQKWMVLAHPHYMLSVKFLKDQCLVHFFLMYVIDLPLFIEFLITLYADDTYSMLSE